MKTKKILAFLFTMLVHHVCNAQINILDSCGLDNNPVLNQYEIKILDSLFFIAYNPKGKIGKSNVHDLQNKKIAFYSCTKNSNTKGDGLLSKTAFFALCRPNFNGHAGRGMINFNQQEKTASKGFDAIIIIDCPYNQIDNKKLIQQLIKKNG